MTGLGPVHVVGAGFAGAACAVSLARADIPVVLWEAKAAPGGRAGSFDDRRSGERLDNGPHLLMGCYGRTLALLERLGSVDQVAFQPAMHLPIRVRGRATGVRCPPLPGPLGLAYGLLTLAPLSLGDRLKLLAAGHRLRHPVVDGASVAGWLDDIAAPERSIELLWAPLCRAIMNLEPADADAAIFVAALRQALLQGPQEARLGWARAGLGALLAPLGDYLAGRGGEVRHGRVTGVCLSDDGGRVSGLLTADGVLEADRVVLATAPEQAGYLLPDIERFADLRKTIAGLGRAPIVSVYLWFDRVVVPMGDTPFLGLVGGPVEWLFDRDRMADEPPATPGQRLGAVISAADGVAGWGEARLVDQALADIARHFPALASVRPVMSRVVKERRATVRLTPGVVRPKPGRISGVDGLFLCGDYTDTGLPATIEGAMRSGERAAAELLAGGAV